jgi:predicted alpha/beta superfamily hydrolase
MSSSFWWNAEDFNNKILTENHPKGITIYLDSGDSGPDQDDRSETIKVRDHFLKLPDFIQDKSLFYYLDQGGQHNEKYWGRRFWKPMITLYPIQVVPIVPSK